MTIRTLNNKQIGQACKKFREEKGYTQQQVADIIHYNVSYISNFECGRSSNFRVFLWYFENGITDNIILDKVLRYGL